MKIDSLRQVLMKKSQDSSLRSFIYHMADAHLVNYVSESLEKMARSFSQKKANPLLISFAKSLPATNKITQMIYDQLSHHATRYKSALNSNNRQLAAMHMSRIMKTLHMIDKMTQDGKINHTAPSQDMLAVNPKLKTALNSMKSENPTDWVCPKPWERHAYEEKSGKHPSPYHTEHYTTKTKGVARDHADYSYVQREPHFSYWEEVKGHGHNKGWPLEQTRVNGRYINIDDNHQSSGQYEPHPLDEHPVMSIYDTPSEQLASDPSIEQRYNQAASDWRAKYLLDPSAYTTMMKRDPNVGMRPSSPVHSHENQLDVALHEKASKTGMVPAAQAQTPASSRGSSVEDVRAKIRGILDKESGAKAAPAAQAPAPAVTQTAPAPEDDGQMSFDLPVEPGQMSMNLDEPGLKRRG